MEEEWDSRREQRRAVQYVRSVLYISLTEVANSENTVLVHTSGSRMVIGNQCAWNTHIDHVEDAS